MPPQGGLADYRISKSPAHAPGSSEDTCLCKEMCYIYGDPHFVTFDGANPTFRDWKLNHFWAVYSEEVKIQGYAKGALSYIFGLAVSGSVLQGHELVIYRADQGKSLSSARDVKVLWDGQEILTEQGSTHTAPGVMLIRSNGNHLQPTDEDLQKVLGRAASKETWLDAQKTLKAWKNAEQYIFMLPKEVTIYVSATKFVANNHQADLSGIEALISMPPQGLQGGWCGNFNYDDTDDSAALYRGGLGDDESYFKRAGIALIDNDKNWTNHPQPELCNGTSRQQAEAACNHTLESQVNLRRACVMDICATMNEFDFINASVNAAVDAVVQIETMELIMGSGIPMFVGHGHCLDAAGTLFTTFELNAVRHKLACVHQLRKMGTWPGVRGAEISDGGKCQVLVELGTNLSAHKLAGGWGSHFERNGTGIITNFSSDPGTYCWKIL